MKLLSLLSLSLFLFLVTCATIQPPSAKQVLAWESVFSSGLRDYKTIKELK